MTQPTTERIPLPDDMLVTGVAAVLRTTETSRLLAVADTLVEAGVTCLEITFTIPGAAYWIATLRKRYGGNATVGAGTVLSTHDLAQAIDAGAKFVVSPVCVPDIVARCRSVAMAAVPGALTPSEAWSAWVAGASAVKLFPAMVIGPEALSAMGDALPDVPLIPTGGIELDGASDWVRAGAVAVGLGGSLMGDALVSGDLTSLADRAGRVLASVASTRAELRP